MQLFTIGLYELNPDGTPRLDANSQPIETYGQSDITNLARVFTGYDWDYLSNGGTFTNVAWHDYDVPSTHFATNPMRFIAERPFEPGGDLPRHRPFPANTPGPEALRIALDTLFNHANVGPFFARQMIQRLVTSNPSAGLRGPRGRGVRQQRRGRARRPAGGVDRDPAPTPKRARCRRAADTLSGKLREPVLRFVQWARTVGVDSTHRRVRDLRPVGQRHRRSGRARCVRRRCSTSSGPATCRRTRRSPRPANRRRSSSCSTRPRVAGYSTSCSGSSRNGYNDVSPTYAELLPIAHDVAGRGRVAEPAAHGQPAVDGLR